MSLLPCAEWTTEDQSKLPVIAQAASSIYTFIRKQNRKRYILHHGDLKEWHRKLFTDVVPITYYAGYYRAPDPVRPCLDGEAHVGGIFGSPAPTVEDDMKKFSDELGRHTKSTDDFFDKPRSTVIRVQAAAQLAAFAGGSIIKIHPFINGNGRIARQAMNSFLDRYLDEMPFFIDRPTNPDYSSASKAAMQTGNFTPLYQYLVELIALKP